MVPFVSISYAPAHWWTRGALPGLRERCRIQRELDPLGAARAFRKTLRARAEQERAQLQQPRVALADAQVGERLPARSGRGRGEDRQRAVESMLRPARFPDRENFLGGETLHRLFHDRRRNGRKN